MPKAYLPLAGKPLLLHAAERLARVAPLANGNRLIVMKNPADEVHLVPLRPSLAALGDVRFADGGDTRQLSMQNGLAAAGDDVDLVLVHDAARALLPIEATRACVEAAARTGAALLAIPAPDTLKRAEGGLVTATVDRAGIWLAQTPQVIRRDLLQRAVANAAATGFVGTDDVSLVEHLGEPVAIVPGAPTNLKVTHPEDLPLAAMILAAYP